MKDLEETKGPPASSTVEVPEMALTHEQCENWRIMFPHFALYTDEDISRYRDLLQRRVNECLSSDPKQPKSANVTRASSENSAVSV